MIRIDGLVARYGRAVAIDRMSLHIPEGSFFGLLGPNGAGKTTAISCIAGLHPPASGTIRVAGFDPVREPRKVLDVLGVVPQRIALYPRLSVVENLRIFGGLPGLHGARLRDRVEWGLELSQLTAHRKKAVEALSGGMQRRLNLAVGLLHKPKVAVCDEPTAGVDPQSRNHIFATLRDLHSEGLTVVYTTHYLEEVEALCDQIAIMDRGYVIQSGSLDELLQGRGAKRIELQRPADRERVVAALEAAGIEVGEIRGRTLEDLLLELTGSALRE